MKYEDIDSLVHRLLPSAFDLYARAHSGTLSVGFQATDDFVAASIAASSANIRAEVFNTFEGKLSVPRSISSCRIKLFLGRDCADERLIWFFAELAILRRSDNSLNDSDFSELNAWLHAQAPAPPGRGSIMSLPRPHPASSMQPDPTRNMEASVF